MVMPLGLRQGQIFRLDRIPIGSMDSWRRDCVLSAFLKMAHTYKKLTDSTRNNVKRLIRRGKTTLEQPWVTWVPKFSQVQFHCGDQQFPFTTYLTASNWRVHQLR